MSQLINEIGNRYGNLLVIGKVENKNNRTAWLCQCDCGNIINVTGKNLRNGDTTSCGCSRGINEIGNKYGRLTVISRDITKPKNHGIYWKCQCECGNITSVRGDQLRNGKIKSCGCLTKKDLINQRFGNLVVISNTNKRQFGQQVWLCKCDCGNVREAPTNYLTGNIITHCGCKTIVSKGEQLIEQFLISNNVIYKPQFRFNDCKNKKSLSYDFAIFKEEKLICLIEYQGEQHFKPNGYFGGVDKFNQQKENDLIKRKYCEEHNISLFYINYNDSIEDKLNEILSFMKGEKNDN